METVSIEVPATPPLVVEADAELSPPTNVRNEKGQFVAGVSGNPAGRPLGSQNKASLIKQLIEDRLSEKLEKEALAIMQKAITMAKQGDRSMIKLLLGDMMAATRSPHNEKASGPITVDVKILNYTQKDEPVPSLPLIEASVNNG